MMQPESGRAACPEDNVIPGFAKLSKQELFDMAAAHVLKNGEPSVNARGSCTYSGIGCAAAPFLTETARNNLLGSWRGYTREGLLPSHEREFISLLQRCHDHWAGPMYRLTGPAFIEKFKESMAELAKEFSLSPAVLG